MKKFCCPECGCGTLEEVMTDAIVSTVVHGCDEHGILEYGEVEIFDGMIDRYQCQHCGRIIQGVNNPGELQEWIEKNGKDEMADEGV